MFSPGDRVMILRGEYRGVIATVESTREGEKGFWANYNVSLILPIEYVPDGKGVPYHDYELEKVN